MFDHDGWIARIEAAEPGELAAMIRDAGPDEARVLDAHFGPERHKRLVELAIRRESTRVGSRSSLGNVVVIPGLMGSQLTTEAHDGRRDTIWLSYWQILLGRLERLRLAEDGVREHDSAHHVSASGILKKYYGVLLLALSERWNVREFWYDWRKDIERAADDLSQSIRAWFGTQPVHLVAHSMGGLVARAFVKKHPEQWRAMADPGGTRGGRLVMLGTPNHGSYLIPQAFVGLAETVASIQWLDRKHDLAGILRILNSFPGPYQMLPSPRIAPKMEPLYETATYGELGVSQLHLARAHEFHDWLADAVDPDRMFQVVGYDQPTVTGLRDPRQVHTLADYHVTRAGDGSVPLNLGPLRDARGGLALPTYFVAEEHTKLTENREVLANLDAVLRTGRFATRLESQHETNTLSGHVQSAVRTSPEVNDPDAHRLYRRQRAVAMREIARLAHRVGTRNDEPVSGTAGSDDRRKLEDALAARFVGGLPEIATITRRVRRDASAFPRSAGPGRPRSASALNGTMSAPRLESTSTPVSLSRRSHLHP